MKESKDEISIYKQYRDFGITVIRNKLKEAGFKVTKVEVIARISELRKEGILKSRYPVVSEQARRAKEKKLAKSAKNNACRLFIIENFDKTIKEIAKEMNIAYKDAYAKAYTLHANGSIPTMPKGVHNKTSNTKVKTNPKQAIKNTEPKPKPKPKITPSIAPKPKKEDNTKPKVKQSDAIRAPVVVPKKYGKTKRWSANQTIGFYHLSADCEFIIGDAIAKEVKPITNEEIANAVGSIRRCRELYQNRTRTI